MFSLPSLSSFKPSFLTWSSSSPRIPLSPVPTHDISALDITDKRLRTLKHLLKLNHINHAVLFNSYRFHNHTPHHLGSTYILGGDAAYLHAVYQSECSGLVPWAESPSEITLDSWRQHLGDRAYQRAYTDFFEDEVVRHNYDWRAVVMDILLTGPEPLINNLATAGLGHPLIHLGYAYELNSRDVGMEALTLAAVCHNDWGKYLNDPSYSTRPAPAYKTTSFAHILARVAADSRLDNLFDQPGGSNLSAVFRDHEAVLLEHWNAWTLDNPRAQFREVQETVAALLISAAHTPYPSEPRLSPSTTKSSSTSTSAPAHSYDFFLLHLLTTSHALRILLPYLPAQHHIPLLRQHLLLTIALYIAQLRPAVDVDRWIKGYETKGRGWEWCRGRALGKEGGKGGLDAHFVKGVRAMMVAGEDWEGGEGGKGFWIKAGVRFAEEFGGWGGFGVMEDGRMGDAGDEF